MIDYSHNLISSTEYLRKITDNLAASISAQKDKILFEVLEENGVNVFDLTEIVRNGKFIRQEGKNYQIFNYHGRDLLQIFEPEVTCEDEKFKVEVRYKKLYRL